MTPYVWLRSRFARLSIQERTQCAIASEVGCHPVTLYRAGGRPMGARIAGRLVDLDVLTPDEARALRLGEAPASEP